MIAITDGPDIRGYNVVVGGGLGMTANKADWIAAMGQLFGFVALADGVEAVKTVAAIYRDHGNRADRRHARVKNLLAEWGIEKLREEFCSRLSFEVAPPAPMPKPVGHDHLGVNRADDGTLFYGLFVQSGRLADTEQSELCTAVRLIVEQVRPGVVITPQRNVLFTGLSQANVDTITQILRAHGATPADELIPLRRHSMACPALPTCGLAVAESERAIPGVLDDLEAGPGASDLITVRGKRLLARADAIVYDRLVSPEMLALAKPDALLVDVGKLPHTPQSSQSAINAQLIAFALQGKRVVRLKGGAPFVLDRGSEATLATIAANANAAGLESPMVTAIGPTAHLELGRADVAAAVMARANAAHANAALAGYRSIGIPTLLPHSVQLPS